VAGEYVLIESTRVPEFQQSAALRQARADFNRANRALDRYQRFEEVSEVLLQRFVAAGDALTRAQLREANSHED
jgi:hypothetical protein